MTQHLVLTVHLHDARYYGTDDWPPAPARVFQALVAGAARGNVLASAAVDALSWLEAQPPPRIAAPRARIGQAVSHFVPNNDADSLSGDLTRIGEIRAKKAVRPRLLEPGCPLIYVWSLGELNQHLDRLLDVALDLYQLGRGVDMAWARAELLDDVGLTALLAHHGGRVIEPATEHAARLRLACPMTGSLTSLRQRYAEQRVRLRSIGSGRAQRELFQQPRKPRFREVSYDTYVRFQLYELRQSEEISGYYSWPGHHAAELVQRLRDNAALRLRQGLPEQHEAIERQLLGRGHVPTSQRIRIVPLPSIGHDKADRAIRRLAVYMPSTGQLRADDVFWAFAGTPHDIETGELEPFLVTRSDECRMLTHYTRASRHFRSVTAVALPESAKPRHVERARQQIQGKSAEERLSEEYMAQQAVREALRHAGVRAKAVHVHVQREPFDAKGSRAAQFAHETRFAKKRLWHVELAFDEEVRGPLVIGDGRFLGLGVMAPYAHIEALHAFAIESGLNPGADARVLARAFRRAVLSRLQAVQPKGSSPLPTYFTGHHPDGAAARGDQSEHLAFHYDPAGRLIVFAPHLRVARDVKASERAQLHQLDQALSGLRHVRAGSAGLLQLTRTRVSRTQDALVAPAREWISVTPYAVNRHQRHPEGLHAAIEQDVLQACLRAGLPTPGVRIESVHSTPDRGLPVTLRLRFAVAQPGPIALGRTRFLGGGLFAGVR